MSEEPIVARWNLELPMGLQAFFKWMSESPYHRKMMERAESDHSKETLDSLESLLALGREMQAGAARSRAHNIRNRYDRIHDQNDELAKAPHRLVISGEALAAIRDLQKKTDKVGYLQMPIANATIPIAGALAAGAVGALLTAVPMAVVARTQYMRAVNAVFEDDERLTAARCVIGCYTIFDGGGGTARATRCWCEPDETQDGFPTQTWTSVDGYEPGIRAA